MKTTAPKKKTIDDEIDHVLETLSTLKPDSKEYASAVDNLDVLCKAKINKDSRRISTETIVSAAVPIIEILLIMYHERLNVISTKAIGFVLKGRL